MSVPNKLGNDSSITKDKGDSKNSDYYKAKNGLAWKGEHVDLDSVVGDYTKEAYEGIANGKYPAGMEDVIRNYFENLATTQDNKVSSHFVIGLEGEVVQCIPTSEISYATNSRNVDTISIECCHPDETGQFNTATYDSAVKLTAWLCTRFGLTSDQVIRHYDVTGKDCPKYYVENPDAWIQMKSDIAAQIQTDYALQGK